MINYFRKISDDISKPLILLTDNKTYETSLNPKQRHHHTL